MNEATLEQIGAEIAAALGGQRFGKIFPLSRLQLAVDFRLSDGQFLFLSVEPAAPRVYLVKRRLRDLERQSVNPGAFVLFLRKRLSGAYLTGLEKYAGERVLRFDFAGETELGEPAVYALVAQLTGRSANLLLLDRHGFILDKARETFGPGQEIGDRYAPPARAAKPPADGEATRKPSAAPDERPFGRGVFATLSEALDVFYLEKEAAKLFQARAGAARHKLRQEIKKRERLVQKMRDDLAAHGDADHWKRAGDLLLANLADAVREDGVILVVDYFDEATPVVEIEADENDSLTQAAEKFFRRYTKARNAKEEITRRLAELEAQLADDRARAARIEEAITDEDENYLKEFLGESAAPAARKGREKAVENYPGARRFVSSDGYEMLVGKGAKDNDQLTFRVAKSLDLWLHAADYPGSHVVVRNPNRGEIPPRTLVEAAQLAAFYSQAREQPKVAVHYTPKKFVNKPKGAALGLVSLSGFKTILVEPKIVDS